jgi:hypothetical protein
MRYGIVAHSREARDKRDLRKTTVTYEGNRVTVTFGPVDLPSEHDGKLAASLPKHVFELPEDMTMVGFQSSVFLKDGTPLLASIFTTFCSSTRTKTVSRARASRSFSPVLVWKRRRRGFPLSME